MITTVPPAPPYGGAGGTVRADASKSNLNSCCFKPIYIGFIQLPDKFVFVDFTHIPL